MEQTVMSVAEYVLLNYILRLLDMYVNFSQYHYHIPNTLVPGSILSA